MGLSKKDKDKLKKSMVRCGDCFFFTPAEKAEEKPFNDKPEDAKCSLHTGPLSQEHLHEECDCERSFGVLSTMSRDLHVDIDELDRDIRERQIKKTNLMDEAKPYEFLLRHKQGQEDQE
jgi:hypothetical protein